MAKVITSGVVLGPKTFTDKAGNEHKVTAVACGPYESLELPGNGLAMGAVVAICGELKTTQQGRTYLDRKQPVSVTVLRVGQDLEGIFAQLKAANDKGQ